MFYRPGSAHPLPPSLPHDPFHAIVAPRPIGWISTRGQLGDNLAPYSFFTAVAAAPPQVIFASTASKPDRGDTKDSVSQIRESGVFCVNLVSSDLAQAMNATSAPLSAGTDEFRAAQIDKAACEMIDCPRVAQAPAALECRLVQIVPLLGKSNFLVHGEVVGVHIRPDCLTDGRYCPPDRLSRLGYMDYASVTETFEMKRP